MNAIAYTHCQICEQRCGLEVHTAQGRVVDIKPDKRNPYSWKDFCIKGATAHRTLEHPMRLRSPMKRQGDRFVPATYDEAIDDISTRLKKILDEHGHDAFADYMGNPPCFTPGTLMFLAGLMGNIGTKNRYSIGSLDQNARHVVSSEMYGGDWAFLQVDLDNCDCFLFIGANPAISTMSWCGTAPNGWKRVLARVADGADLMVVDPRRTESAQKAKLHVAPLPEQDWALLLAMIHQIFHHGWENAADCADATGIETLRDFVLARDPAELARRCDVPLETITQMAERFAKARTAAAIARTGPAQGLNGSLTEWLAHVLNLITGRTDRAGGYVFIDRPINVMGALPNAPKMHSRVRGIGTVAGMRTIAELPDEIMTPGPGQVRALLMVAGNPVSTGPNGARLDAALRHLDLFVSMDLFMRESHRHAHWLIPGVHFLERTDCPSPWLLSMFERPFLQKTQRAVPPPSDVREEWEFLRDLAAAIGLPIVPDALDITPDQMNDGMLKAIGAPLTGEIATNPHGMIIGERHFGALRASLLTPDKRIQACPPVLFDLLKQRLAEPVERNERDEYPYQIISRRRLHMMNTWLVETTAQDMRARPGSTIEISVEDSTRDGLSDGDEVIVSSAVASIEAIVAVSSAVRPGVAVMDHGWGSALLDPSTGAVVAREGVNRNLLVSHQDLDPLSGVARLNGTPISIEKLLD